MTNEKKSLVFFGSGPVAAESLKLLSQDFDIEAVVTKATTKEQMKAACPDAEIFCVDNKERTDELFTTKNFKSNVGVLIDFGIIVSKKIIDSFEFGIVNSHFSLLPELRGADPISFSILNGKTKTGVSLMLLVEAMDEGPILSVGMFDLDGTETTPILTNELIQLSYKLLSENLPRYLDGSIEPAEQEVVQKKFNLTPSYTRKLTKTDGTIDWTKDATQIEREVRAYNGWPKSRTKLGGIDVVILKTKVINISGKPGELFIQDKELGVYCGSDSLIIEQLMPAGKKSMSSQSFLAGYKTRLPL